MTCNTIRKRGARTHNSPTSTWTPARQLNVFRPVRFRQVLARFDTIYAEGQRRYV